jgi:hypothetical protein
MPVLSFGTRMDPSIDFTREFAQLLKFTASVATAIRMYSAYNQGEVQREHAQIDLMFLSDSLHNFDRLGSAVLQGVPANIVTACDSLLETYGTYQFQDSRFGLRQGKATFDRNAHLVSLPEAVDVFKHIRAKALPFVLGI